MARTLSNIAVHHAGGLGTNAYASTRHLTPAGISAAHKALWDFPSLYMKDRSGKPWYGGYNVVYDPKDRSFTQFRALGEETAAQYGHNTETFSLCIIGNYMRRPISNPSAPVDPMDEQMQQDITSFLFDLIAGNKRGLVVVPGTTLDLSIMHVHPHRFFNSTDCYGSFLPDSFFRDLLIKYKPTPDTLPPLPADFPGTLQQRAQFVQIFLTFYAIIIDLVRGITAPPVGRIGRDCPGTLPEDLTA